MCTPSCEHGGYSGWQARLTTETGSPVHLEPDRRRQVESLPAYIGRYYEDFFHYPDAREPLAAIREGLARRGTLGFSDRYPERVIPLIQETVAWEMYLCDYFPGRRDRIEFGVIETLSMDQLKLMFATGVTDTSGISHLRIFIREDILRSSAGDTDSFGRGFDTFSEEIRHSVEALWRNRVGYLTTGQQSMLNSGRLQLPPHWPDPGYCDAPFVPQILGESAAHLMDYVRYGHDRYGKGSDYSSEYFVDPVVRNGSVTLCQTDAHRPAQAVDRVIRQKLDLWNTTGPALPTLARRINQFFILSVPGRRKPLSESTLRSWQELHDLPYVVGGLFHSGLEPSRLRLEVLRARILARKLHHGLLSDGVGVGSEGVYQDTLAMLERVSDDLRSKEGSLNADYVLQVKQSMWRLLRLVGRALSRGSALEAVVEEIVALKDLASFYGALVRKTQDAVRNVVRMKPADRETRILLHALLKAVTSEARAMGLPIHFHATDFEADTRGQPPDQTGTGHLAA